MSVKLQASSRCDKTEAVAVEAGQLRLNKSLACSKSQEPLIEETQS